MPPPSVLWERGSYYVAGIGDTKENKTSPRWPIAHGLLGEVRYAEIPNAVILICKARLPKHGEEGKMGIVLIWINQGRHHGGR